MSPEEREALLAAYLAKTISDADRDRLARELRADPRFARSAQAQWVTEKLLSLELDTRGRRAFVEEVSDKIRRGLGSGETKTTETDGVADPMPAED